MGDGRIMLCRVRGDAYAEHMCPHRQLEEPLALVALILLAMPQHSGLSGLVAGKTLWRHIGIEEEFGVLQRLWGAVATHPHRPVLRLVAHCNLEVDLSRRPAALGHVPHLVVQVAVGQTPAPVTLVIRGLRHMAC